MSCGASAQLISTKKAAPAYGFGSASRDQVNKLFVSQEHTLIATGGKDSPGPAKYLLPASVGGKQPDGRKPDPPTWTFSGANRFLYGYGKPDKKPGPDEYNMPPSVGGTQPDGARANAPSWGFGSATRDGVKKVFVSQKHTLTVLHGSHSPGPAKYLLPPSVGGKQPDGRKPDPPSYGFSSAARTPVEPGNDGPGFVYKITPAVGPQPDSQIKNMPLYSFGASTREVRERVFISQEHNEGMPPSCPTPGPANSYQLDSALGKQNSARKKTSPRVSFSQASRWAAHERELARNTVPGPGAYG